MRAEEKRLVRAWHVASVLAVVLVAFGQGCKSTPPEGELTITAEVVAPAAPSAKADAEESVASVPEDAQISVDDVVPLEDTTELNELVFPRRNVLSESREVEFEYPGRLVEGMPDVDEKVEVWLNLDATPLTEIVPMFAEPNLLNFSYLIDPNVKGAITMQVDAEMTAREAWEMFEHILWLSGAYASKNPGFIHIMPFEKMPRERRLLAKHEPMANVEVRLVPIYYAKAQEVASNLSQFTTEGATVIEISRSNALLIVEAPANVPKLLELIKGLDNRGEAAWPHVCIRCHSVDAEALLEELNALLPVLGFPVTSAGPSGGSVKVIALPRLQVVVASAALQEVLDEVERWCRVLDRTDEDEKESIFFYNVKHSTAAQLSEFVTVFFSAETSKSGKASQTKSTSSTAGTSTDSTSTSSTSRTSSKAARTSATSGEGDTIFDTPVVMYVDEIQNRLVIRTTSRAYSLMQALLERQDVPLRQVLIEAAVAEITLTDATEFGFAYAAQGTLGGYGYSHAVIGTSAFDSTTTTDTTTDDDSDDDTDTDTTADLITSAVTGLLDPTSFADGYALSLSNSVDKLAFLRAVAGEGNVRLLSAPQIIAANDQEAVINVGESVPVITGDYNDTSTYTRRSYSYQDTGTILTVTPHITAGNEVQLEITQEVSSAVTTETGVSDSPTIKTKKLQTVMVISDGQTLMMGGLIDTQVTDTHTGVPYLKDVPYVGRLFRTNSKSRRRTEMLVMVTVHVVDKPTQTDRLIARYSEALKEIREQLNP